MASSEMSIYTTVCSLYLLQYKLHIPACIFAFIFDTCFKCCGLWDKCVAELNRTQFLVSFRYAFFGVHLEVGHTYIHVNELKICVCVWSRSIRRKLEEDSESTGME